MESIKLLTLVLLVSVFAACKAKIEPPVPLDKKIAVCDSIYNFDKLADNGNLDRNSFLKYEDCLCNTIAPDAVLETDMGLSLSIKKLKGKAIIVYTWSPNNPGYKEDLIYLKKLKDESKGKLELVSLSMFDPINMPPELPTGTGTMHNVILGIEVLRTGFGMKPNFPTAIFIDKNGIIRDVFTGLTYNFNIPAKEREERINRGLKKIL